MNMSASSVVTNLLRDSAAALGEHVMKHGGHYALVKDVMLSCSAWMPEAAQAAMLQLLLTGPPDEATHMPVPHDMTGTQLDAAFATLRLLNVRRTALTSLSTATTCSTAVPGVMLMSESWLMPRKRACQHWQYSYETHISNTADEPLQVIQKTISIKELSGAQRERTSTGLSGLQPVIACGSTVAHRTAITLDSFKGSLKCKYMLQGVQSGRLLEAQMPDLALTPTAAHYNDAAMVDSHLSGADASAASKPEGQQQLHQQHCAPANLCSATPRAFTSSNSSCSTMIRNLFPLLHGLPAPGTSGSASAATVAAAAARSLPARPFKMPDVWLSGIEANWHHSKTSLSS